VFFFSAEWKQEGVREGMLGWECNCYKYTALCFLSAKWKQEGPGGNVGWECNCYKYTALCFFVSRVEAEEDQGGNVGVGV
jgi:hypothetical protein